MFDDKVIARNCKNVYLKAMLENLIEQFQQKNSQQADEECIASCVFLERLAVSQFL